MTQPPANQQLRSAASGRNVVPGWTQLIKGQPDVIEVQLDVDQADLNREHGCLLIEYWAGHDDLTLQSILPTRAFKAATEGWCVFIPAQGRVLVRAIDPQPTPPLLASHWINVEPNTPAGTVVNVSVKFPPEGAEGPGLQG
ncbi:uracil-DNA glycosylase [Deinococcus hopiensis]|uniref:Uncharacterized protein n=1 Tax=Deinococcus hopiensis KR-140 TaxID=695939 RepID=A0A1W1VNV1_9DEIO|nr:uracil-DNA glycosylase [Deinococcus hopiensis]SMB95065.1 hypothetical protein SAMN00790413_02675 [Deinococcus hopiensis KR-140]